MEYGRDPAKGFSTGQVPLKNDHLSESTPGGATESITTAAAARSRWTISCVSNPPNECPMMIGFSPRARMLWTWCSIVVVMSSVRRKESVGFALSVFTGLSRPGEASEASLYARPEQHAHHG